MHILYILFSCIYAFNTVYIDKKDKDYKIELIFNNLPNNIHKMMVAHQLHGLFDIQKNVDMYKIKYYICNKDKEIVEEKRNYNPRVITLIQINITDPPKDFYIFGLLGDNKSIMVGPFSDPNSEKYTCLVDGKVIELRRSYSELSEPEIDKELSYIDSKEIFICVVVGLPIAFIIILGSIFMHRRLTESKSEIINKKDLENYKK
jgi:hypothetical protein